MNYLNKCTSIFGTISDEYKSRIERYINSSNPNSDDWDDISLIIIDGRKLTTVWQAVLDLDNSFPQTGRSYDKEDKIVHDWPRIPHPFTVARAIQNHFIKKH